MNLQNKTNQKGFTIVELLIVIVVIGILAAITIVAYNGIQNRAKTTSGQSLANNIAKKTEAYNTIKSAYPTAVADFAGEKESTLDDTSAVTTTALSSTSANGGKVVYFVGTATTGACIGYWDYTVSTSNVKYVKVGAGSGTTC